MLRDRAALILAQCEHAFALQALQLSLEDANGVGALLGLASGGRDHAG